MMKSRKHRKNKRPATRKQREKRTRHNRTLRKRIRGGHVDQETTETLEGVPIESRETAMVAGPGFSMSAGEYEAMMEQLDRDGSDY